ncbi:MAG: cation diffusion facilitator family transporter [Brevundimonas sp.]|jgi:cobalt-zinc-cadmium efflux system protein|uniref:cation diffusion facilitator family transporter n=1 Tax=Brevundimonas sp. TaxID=1871086 RepID=UPI00391C417E
MHAHSHHHGHGHGHGHGHHGHHHHGAGEVEGWRYGLALIVNLAFVAIEFTFGFLTGSAALLADAGHNLADVMGLALAGGAAWMARLSSSTTRTYGFGKATILAALANGVLLVFACGLIASEAVHRLMEPVQPASVTIMVVAGIGFFINLGTALLFLKGRHADLNARGAYLHMLADAAVSLGVVVVGALMLVTDWRFIDPAVALVIVAIILAGTWGLLRDSFNLALDGVPAGVDVVRLRAALKAERGVSEVHDLHVWALSTTRNAMSVHIRTHPDNPEADQGADLLARLRSVAQSGFGIHHVTIQIEPDGAPGAHDCAQDC